MISWTLTLTSTQIAILKAFEDRVSGKESDGYLRAPSNIIPGMRTLIREGLMEHREVKAKSGYMDTLRSGHFITERGLFILAVIEEDIEKFLTAKRAAGENRKSLKRVG